MSPPPPLWRSGLAAVWCHPRLWFTAAVVAGRTARRGWWRRPPHRPAPAADYLRFRLTTQYGDGQARPSRDDITHYLEWCRRERSRRDR